MNQYRDTELGHKLTIFDSPEHHPGYWDSVEKALVPEPTPRRLWWRRPLAYALAAAAVTAAVLVVALVGLPGGNGVGPEPATAAERLLARVTLAMSTARTLTGGFVERTQLENGRWEISATGTFARTSEGDYRLDRRVEGPPRRLQGQLMPTRKIDTYDSQTHTARDLVSLGEGWEYGHEFVNELVETTDMPNVWREAAVIPALLAESKPTLPVESTTLEGSAVWKATLTDSTRPDWSLEIFVDQQTGFIVRQIMRDQDGAWERRFTDLTIDAPVSQDLFTIEFPGDVRLMSSTGPLHYIEAGEVETRVGYRPPLPEWLPTRFALSETATNAVSDPATGAPDASDPFVVAWYRRGFDWLKVEVRKVDPPGSLKASDLEASFRQNYPMVFGALQPVELHGGAFAGTTAYTLIDAVYHGASGPVSLVAVNQDYLVTLSGDLTRQELTRVANSLQPHSD